LRNQKETNFMTAIDDEAGPVPIPAGFYWIRLAATAMLCVSATFSFLSGFRSLAFGIAGGIAIAWIADLSWTVRADASGPRRAISATGWLAFALVVLVLSITTERHRQAELQAAAAARLLHHHLPAR
jgi:hypothetical protein